MAGLRRQMQHWAKFLFGSIKLKKLALFHELENIDIVKETWLLLPLEYKQEEDLLMNLSEIRKQRSRLQWLKEGDENTHFFHAVANGRKNQNLIPSICFNRTTLTNPRDIGKIFSARFNQ